MSSTKLLVLFSLLSVGSLTACGNKVTFGLSESSAEFNQSKGSFTDKIDILWVVDNSLSMAPIQSNLSDNFGAFISTFQSKHFDYQMGVTTTEAYLGGSMAKFRDGTDATGHTGIFTILPTTPNLNNVFVTNLMQGTGGSGDERAFSSFKAALTSPLNGGFLRPNAFLAVVILSDEDDFSDSARCSGCPSDHDYASPTLDSVNSYVSFLDGITGSGGANKKYSVSSIAALDSNCVLDHSSTSTSTIVGQRYIDIASKTGGVLGSICDKSYAAALDKIQARILELSTQFVLNESPQPDSLIVLVDGNVVAPSSVNGWTYNAEGNSVMFHGAAVPQPSSHITVRYVPARVRG